jgi:hypothetical protein
MAREIETGLLEQIKRRAVSYLTPYKQGVRRQSTEIASITMLLDSIARMALLME